MEVFNACSYTVEYVHSYWYNYNINCMSIDLLLMTHYRNCQMLTSMWIFITSPDLTWTCKAAANLPHK